MQLAQRSMIGGRPMPQTHGCWRAFPLSKESALRGLTAVSNEVGETNGNDRRARARGALTRPPTSVTRKSGCRSWRWQRAFESWSNAARIPWHFHVFDLWRRN